MKSERTVKKLMLAAIAFFACASMLLAAAGCGAGARSSDGGLLEGCATCAAACAGCTCLTCSALTCAALDPYNYTYVPELQFDSVCFID